MAYSSVLVVPMLNECSPSASTDGGSKPTASDVGAKKTMNLGTSSRSVEGNTSTERSKDNSTVQ